MHKSLISIVLGLLLAGCATHNTILVATGTSLGVEIAQNPATGLYQAKLGYNRAELALVPTSPTNGYTPDVLTELPVDDITPPLSPTPTTRPHESVPAKYGSRRHLGEQFCTSS